MIIQFISIAVALIVIAIVAFRLKNKKKKKSKPSLYKPRTIESVQSTLIVKKDKPQSKKPVKVLNVQDKKPNRELTTKHETEPTIRAERNEPAPRKVINTAERAVAKPQIVKPEIKLVKKLNTSTATNEPTVQTEPEMTIEPDFQNTPTVQAAPAPAVVETIERVPIIVTNFEEFVSEKFDPQYYTTRAWDKAKFVEETESLNHLPNIEVEFNSKRTISIALETIWIEAFNKGGLDWAVDFDLKDQKQFFSRRRMPYFIVIGVGGTEVKPKELFIVPLQKIETEFLSKADLLHYQKNKVDGNFFYDYSSNVLR